MACTHITSLSVSPPGPVTPVYREDCTQCFDSIDDPDGLDVCLSCFNGGCPRAHSGLHASGRNHPLALNIRRTRKVVDRDEPPLKKLAIAAETEENRYDTTLAIKCHECTTETRAKDVDARLAPVIQGVLKANTFSRKEEVKAWEQELTSCEHVLLMQQTEARTIESGDLGHCSGCDLRENLWLCLECGNLGCGRKQMGGLDGNSHALDHSNVSGHGVAVKLGSITPEGTADIYCYKCGDEKIDDELSSHLAHWGIRLAERQKTEKSLTEMQIEQNLKWDFSMTSEDGKTLVPVFGPGLTGLRNLGNSCYLASIMQCLFNMPSFKNRYYQPNEAPPSTEDPAADLETQLRKIADGLWSGRYSKSDPHAPSEEAEMSSHQRGIAPSMLKHLVGRGHPEFSTMRQQDAFEFLQHIFKLISRAQHPAQLSDPTQPFRFLMEQRLQCLKCKKVRYTITEQDNVFLDVPLNKVATDEEADGKTGDTYKVVSLEECLGNLTAMELVELSCSACGSKDGYTKRSLFKTLPDVLAINARKMTVVNWVPIKVDVPVIVPDGPFPLDKYLSRGLQPDEHELPDEPVQQTAPAFLPNIEAVAQLEAMGFPKVRCEKALHATGNSDANAAMEWLFAHMDDPDIDEPLVIAAASVDQGSAMQDDPDKIEMLCAMGFSAPQAKKALRQTGGDMERAVEWVFSHPDDQGVFEDGDTPAAGGGTTVPVAPKEHAGTAARPAIYQLQSIACHKGTSIHAGHYVAFIRKQLPDREAWVLFNDEKVVEALDFKEMSKFAYVYFFKRVR